MRLNNDFTPDPDGDTNVFKSLKNVTDLPEEMLEIVSANATELAKSLEKQSLETQANLKDDGEEEDTLGIILTPFIMELSFLKIQLAALIDQVAELQNGDSN
jgi:hypothetical protein